MTLEEMANRAKENHKRENDVFPAPETEEKNDQIEVDEESKFDMNNLNHSEDPKNTESSVIGEGIVSQMNQSVINDSDDDEDPFVVPEPESVVDPDIDVDDDDETTIIIPDAPEPEVGAASSILENDEFELTDEEIMEAMPDIPEEDALPLCEDIRTKTTLHRKDLLIYKKLSPDDATAKAKDFMKDLAETETIKYLKDHPNLLVMTVNKENEKDLKFTDEEKEKIVKSKVIKLEVVESQDLLVQKVRKVEKRNKLAIVQSMDRYMAQYSVPLPVMCDFVTFKGAQLIEINNLRVDQDTTILEITEKKANLVYKQLLSGANLQKFDDNGKGKLSYVDFLNKFPINDLDLAVYGVMVASSMEDMETEINCDDCGKPTTVKYNMKTLMGMNGLSDDFKDRFNDILKNKSNTAYLQKLYEDNNKTHVVKSPITQNIYKIDTPSIARAIGLYQRLDPENEIDAYLSVIYQYLSEVMMYDKEHDDYIQIDEKEYQELFAAVRTLPQKELNLLGQFIEPMVYRPYFSLKTKCENCGFEMEKPLSSNDLCFLAAQGSEVQAIDQ